MEARVSEPAQKLQTILIVDDEPSIRLLFRSALQSLPARILEADNGLEAMSLIEQEKPALVVTDYAMPDWDGLEVCHQIRKRPEDRKSTRLNSSHGYISYAVFCLKKKNNSA